jgi:hypothetical protein
MSGIGEPFDDRPQALRDPGNRVADAVIVHQEEAHDRSVQTVVIARQQHACMACITEEKHNVPGT